MNFGNCVIKIAEEYELPRGGKRHLQNPQIAVKIVKRRQYFEAQKLQLHSKNQKQNGYLNRPKIITNVNRRHKHENRSGFRHSSENSY